MVCVCSVGYRSMVYATELQKEMTAGTVWLCCVVVTLTVLVVTVPDKRPMVLVSYCSLGYRGLKYADAVTTEQQKGTSSTLILTTAPTTTNN